MEKFCRYLLDQMTSHLRECDASRKGLLEWIEHCFRICELTNQRIQEVRLLFPWESKNVVIRFNREWNPGVRSWVEYFKELYKAEIFAPLEHDEDVVDYWKREIELARKFILRHEAFYEYCKSGCNKEDENYFLELAEEGSYSELLSKLMAKERMISYCRSKISVLENNTG